MKNNQILDEFDRYVFESIIEKVIIGGVDKDGNKDPYMITFVYKTGLKSEIENAKKNCNQDLKGKRKKNKDLCSFNINEHDNMYSFDTNNTYREYRAIAEE